MTDAAAPGAPRLGRIQLTDFRAFPPSGPCDLVLDGCNLLAFGENGSGKSSLYRAMRDLFSVEVVALSDQRNRLCPPADPEDPPRCVRITLTSGEVIDWTDAEHPTARVRDIARCSAFLTHTRLREMNYNSTGPDLAPNLFDFAVSQMLADFEVTLAGGGKSSIGELWTAVLATQRISTRRTRAYRRLAEAACERFNDGMRQALEALQITARPLLTELLGVLASGQLELVDFYFPQVHYAPRSGPLERDHDPRDIEGRVLTAVVKAKDYTPTAPQDFLNEGRQSALAIAICLAARRVCVPEGRERLKLLVLDDLLISLDASHRRPVLKVILEQFIDWQIILLTHDRYWFQLAREQLNHTWKAVEMYERFDGNGLLQPMIRPVEMDYANALLDQADVFLADHFPAAAANYARSACELLLKRYCSRLRLKQPFRDEEDPPTGLEVMRKAAMNGAKAAHDEESFSALKALAPHRKFVLNPFSHDPAHPVPEVDVSDAIAAVREVARKCG